MDIIIRDIEIKDLEDYLYWMMPERTHHKYNGPYFKSDTQEELREYVEEVRDKLKNGEDKPFGNKKMIVDAHTDEIIGVISWHWRSQETLWMEIGLIVFNENYWGRGIGTIAMKKWISQMFDEHKEIVRLGFTTWSGNIGMCKVAEKLGLVEEARYRKARIVNGEYYDSVSYGVLREEW